MREGQLSRPPRADQDEQVVLRREARDAAAARGVTPRSTRSGDTITAPEGLLAVKATLTVDASPLNDGVDGEFEHARTAMAPSSPAKDAR